MVSMLVRKYLNKWVALGIFANNQTSRPSLRTIDHRFICAKKENAPTASRGLLRALWHCVTSRRFVDSSTPHTLLPTHHTFHTTWHKVHIHPAAPELLQAVAGDHGNNVEMLEQSASFWELCCALYIAVHHAGLTLDTWEPIQPGSRNYF